MDKKVLVENLKKIFRINLNKGDLLFLEQIILDLLSSEDLKQKAQINSIDDFKFAFNKSFINLIIDKINQNSVFFSKIMDDAKFRDVLMEYLLSETYKKLKNTPLD